MDPNYENEHPTTRWTDIQPKVTAAGLAYAASLAVVSILTDFGLTLSVATIQAVTGFVMLLAAYLWPGA